MAKSKIQKELSELSAFSKDNLKSYRKHLGPEAVALAASLIEKHPELFTLSLFHETGSKNIPAIQASGTVYSYDQLAAQSRVYEGGMTYKERTLCETFNTVAHEADAYTDFVYMRPHFGPAAVMPHKTGFYLADQELSPDMWMSFRDPNQTMDGDKFAIEMGISIVLGFSQGDAFVAKDIPEVLALKTLSLMANIAYTGAFKAMIYKAEMQAYDENPGMFIKPKEKNNITMDEAFNFYTDLGSLELIETSPHSLFEGKKYHDAWLKIIKENDLMLPYKGATLSDKLLQDPKFEEYFLKTFEVLAAEIANKGQIAVPQSFSIKNAQAVIYGVVQQPADTQSLKPLQNSV